MPTNVVSILDPLRVAEDYATVDQLSRGRLELVIGKGNELRQLPMFGVEQGQQWEMLARLATEVVPVVREAAPDTLWSGEDPYGGRPAFAGSTAKDAAAIIKGTRYP